MRGVLSGALLILTRRPMTRVSGSDLRRRAIGQALEIRVMWIDRPGEVGPTYSVFAGRQELVRVDLFDEGAHQHPVFALLFSSGASGGRQLIHAPTLQERMEFGADELSRNLAFNVGSHPSATVRRITWSEGDLHAAADWLTAQLRDLVDTHGGSGSSEAGVGQ